MQYWDPHALQIPQAYGLIKLHKEPKKLRIITPVINWLNLKVAKWVTQRLQRFVSEIPHVLSNSMTLSESLLALDLYSHCMVTYDVSDMYNSIDQEDCLDSLKQLAKVKGWWDANLTGDRLLW